MTWRRQILLLLLLLTFCFSLPSSAAKTDSVRVYTEEHPLVYVDNSHLWPYSFLNDKDEPEGFCVDLVRMLMEELNIPYVIKLEPEREVFNDMKEGRGDLTFGLAMGFNNDYGNFGSRAITLLTQSVVTPRSKPIEIKSFRDMNKPGLKVIVSNSSLCHHLMRDYGWGEHAVVTHDMDEAILQLSKKKEGQIVWNTLSLKWLIHYYNIDNVVLTPVDMPHGSYRFMSNDQHLLDLLDDAYAKLYMAGKITPLQEKWFYPEHQESEALRWVWYLTAMAGLLLLIAILYILSNWIQNRRVTVASNKLNRRLALIIETSKVRIWTYDVKTNEVAWHNEKGQVTYTYTMEEFSHRYREDDFRQLREALDRLISQHKDAHGHEEEEETLELKAKDLEGGDHELHDFVVVLSVLRRDKNGKPTAIIGIKKDVTEKLRLKRLEDERTLRYWSIFYSQDAAIIYFGKDGYLQNINPKASEICQRHSDDMIDEHIHINDFFKTSFTDLSAADKYQGVQKVYQANIEYQLKTVFNDEGELLGIFAFCREATNNPKSE